MLGNGLDNCNLQSNRKYNAIALFSSCIFLWTRSAYNSTNVAIGRIGICTSDIVMGADIIYCSRNRS